MKLRVAPTTQINHGGQLYRAGETLEVADTDPQARIWLARGWATRQGRRAAQEEPTVDATAPDGGDKPAADEQAETPAEQDVSQLEPIPDAELADASRDDLRGEAGRLGIAKSGTKDELLERIRAARAG